MNPKEVLEDQNNFKSDLGEMQKRKSKSKDQISVIQYVIQYF